jgi:hypothetical protein
MIRYGWLEHHSTDRKLWRLTAMGHAILDGGDLTKTMQTMLDKLSPAQRVRLTREIGQSGSRSPDEIKAALRREWQRTLFSPRRR